MFTILITWHTLANRRISRKSRFLLACIRLSSFSPFSASFLFLMISAKKDKIIYEHLQLNPPHTANHTWRPSAQWMGTLSPIDCHWSNSDLTCVAVSHLACLSVPKALGAQVENKVVVVRKYPEPQVNQITELIHCFDVCICSAEIRI